MRAEGAGDLTGHPLHRLGEPAPILACPNETASRSEGCSKADAGAGGVAGGRDIPAHIGSSQKPARSSCAAVIVDGVLSSPP